MLGLLERDGIAHAGAGRNRIEAWRPATLMCGTTRVVMIACTDNEAGWEATSDRPGTCYVPTDLKDARTQELLSRVADVKQESDCLIVSCHWGANWGYRPPKSHIRFGRALIDAGADIVFGHSAHVFRGIELHRGRPILYSTGNFIDDYAVDEIERNDESCVFVLDFEKGVAPGIRLYPTMIRDFQARMAGPETARSIAEKMRILCAELGTPSTWDPMQGCLAITTSDAAEHAA
jgi:poly-gamma-glutamate synthesis protein (capsule biosynthesis protein)